MLVEGLRQGRDHHLGDASRPTTRRSVRTRRSTSRAAARAAPRSPGTPTPPPGSATRTSAACSSRCTARPRPGCGDPVAGVGRRRRRPGAPPRATSGPAARAGTCGSPGTRRVEIVAAAHVHTIKDLRAGPGRRLLADPGDVDGVATPSGARFVELLGGVDDVVLRLVRRPAGRLAAGVRRPDRRAGVRRLVERHLPADVGLERAGHPHARTRTGWPRPATRARRSSWSRPDYADNTKFADEWLPAQPGTDGALAMAMGHVILKEFFVDRRVPFFVDYVAALHRPAVPGDARANSDGAYVPGQVPHRRRPRRRARRGRGVEDRARRRPHRRAGGAERVARLPLHRVRRRAGGTSTSTASRRS